MEMGFSGVLVTALELVLLELGAAGGVRYF